MSDSHLRIPRNETVQPPYFQNRITIPTLIYLWEIYIFPGSVCLGLSILLQPNIWTKILEIYKLLTDTWMWKLGQRPHNSQKRNAKTGILLQCYPTRSASTRLLQILVCCIHFWVWVIKFLIIGQLVFFKSSACNFHLLKSVAVNWSLGGARWASCRIAAVVMSPPHVS